MSTWKNVAPKEEGKNRKEDSAAVGMHLSRDYLAVCSDLGGISGAEWVCEFPGFLSVDDQGNLITGFRALDHLNKNPGAQRFYLLDLLSGEQSIQRNIQWPTFFGVYLFFKDVYAQLKALLPAKWDGCVVLSVPIDMIRATVLLRRSMEYAGFHHVMLCKSSILGLLHTLYEQDLIEKDQIYLVVSIDDKIANIAALEGGEGVVEELDTVLFESGNLDFLKQGISFGIDKMRCYAKQSEPLQILIYQEKEVIPENFFNEAGGKNDCLRHIRGRNAAAKGARIQAGKMQGYYSYCQHLLLNIIGTSISLMHPARNKNKITIVEANSLIPNKFIISMENYRELLSQYSHAEEMLWDIGGYSYTIPVKEDWRKNLSDLEIIVDVDAKRSLEICVKNRLSGEAYKYFPMEEIIDYGPAVSDADTGVNILYSFMFIVLQMKDWPYSMPKTCHMDTVGQGLLQIRKQCINLLLRYRVIERELLDWNQFPISHLPDKKVVITDIIQIIDSFDYATKMIMYIGTDPLGNLLLKIQRQLTRMIEHYGVVPMKVLYKKYDPMFSNAVEHISDSRYEDGIIIEEFKKGYMYEGRVLRHSDVKVAN